MTEAGIPPRNRMAIAILALVGVLISTYMLAYGLGLTGPVICGLGDCEKVQNSEFARIGPIPVAVFGVLGYLALIVLSFLGLQPGRAGSKRLAWLLVLGAAAGFAFSAYLTYLEAFVIHAWCQWCVGSAVVMLLVAVATLPELRRVGGSS